MIYVLRLSDTRAWSPLCAAYWKTPVRKHGENFGALHGVLGGIFDHKEGTEHLDVA